VYFSDVIVGAGSDASSFEDLRGRSFAYNERASHSGYGIVRYELVRRGETHGFFGRLVESGAHQQSIRMVAAGEVEASAIDSQVLAVELRDHAELRERLRVIDSLGPSTIQPVVVAAHVPVELRERVRELLLAAHGDARLRAAVAAGFVERFVAADDSSYDDIRDMLRACEKAHFLVLR
jgi:phosphonate transport system substrate-binding protein